MEPMKHIDYMKLTRRLCFPIPTPGVCGYSSAGLTAAINGGLASYVPPLGGNLQNTMLNLPQMDTEMGLVSTSSGVIDLTTQEPFKDPTTNRIVRALISRRSPTTNLVTITGFAVDFFDNYAPVDAANNIFRFTAPNIMEYSNNGGVTWGAPVDVSALLENDCITLRSGPGSWAFVRRTAAALPVGNVTETLTVNQDNYAVGLSYSALGGENIPFIIPTADIWGLELIITCQASMIRPSMETITYNAYADFIESSPSIMDVLAYETRTDVNTPTGASVSLGFTPVNQNGLEVICRGYRFTPGPAYDYTLTGNVVTFYPTQMGFHINFGEPVYFRGFTA